MVKKNKQKLLIGLVLLSILVITVGATYAFFSYTKQGTKDNVIETGTITFLYTEIDKVGAGIEIEDAIPMSDGLGKVQTGDNKVFNFKIQADTTSTTAINYEITAKKSDDSTLDEKVVKLYLTKVNNTTEEEVLLNTFDKLDLPTKEGLDTTKEKLLYKGKVPSDMPNYEQSFRLRMWIDEKTDFSGIEQEDGSIVYPYNDKSFKINVNVYANGNVLTQEDITYEKNTNISTLSVDGTTLTAIEDEEHDYEMELPEGTTSTTINVETENENATVNVEKIDSLAYETSNIKRLSTQKSLDLNPGDNYFKITVISENGRVEKEYILKIYVDTGTTLLSDAIFSKYTTIYENPTLTDSSNNTSDPSGLYKSTATNSGDPTYYFRGNVENNYVDFAGFTWRIVRINEDGTIRLVMQDAINSSSTTYIFNSSTVKTKMYYSNNSTAKLRLEAWYSSNIDSNSKYSNRVATGYYCEQAKIAKDSTYAANSGADMIVYTEYKNPNFECKEDANGFGLVNASVGLLSYDEVLHAGGYYGSTNKKYYLYNASITWGSWLMSPNGFSDSKPSIWTIQTSIGSSTVDSNKSIRAVINLKADTAVSGEGSGVSHWVVKN